MAEAVPLGRLLNAITLAAAWRCAASPDPQTAAPARRFIGEQTPTEGERHDLGTMGVRPGRG